MNVVEIIQRLKAGEISAAEAAQEFRLLCAERGCRTAQFDQLERRLVAGVPVVILDEEAA